MCQERRELTSRVLLLFLGALNSYCGIAIPDRRAPWRRRAPSLRLTAHCPQAGVNLVTCPSSGIEQLNESNRCCKPLVFSLSIPLRLTKHDIGRLSVEPVLARVPFKCSKHKLNNLSCRHRAIQAHSAAHQRVEGAVYITS